MLSAGAGLTVGMPESIARALAINPAVGSTYQDAEHIVILMQENRSFDHCYGTLQGVRGFNDPRAINLPNKNKVWLQTNDSGETYAPFRLNINETKSTWMGSLPHSWTDQVDARNKGRYDQWLIAKRSGNKEYKNMPLTLGYYNREDLPFYYSLADAFTVCDQNFCSSLTGTTPNRLYLWTGTIREEASTQAYANVRNENVDYDKEAHWKTFPERLEENGVSWRIYQNELSVGVGFEGEEDAWLGNFTDNPIEWFAQYHVKYHPEYIRFIPRKIEWINQEIGRTEASLASATAESADRLTRKLSELKKELEVTRQDQTKYTIENYNKLPDFQKSIHEKAFTTNRNDSSYHKLTSLKYRDGVTEREANIPAGDTLHQFREDVKNAKLPTVSWLVAPENFSDHPGAPWYGAWYVSEVLDILTKNPEVWKKTIFILAYDENDGYFDHVPPFTVPNPAKKGSGLTSASIRTDIEYVTVEQDKRMKAEKDCRDSSIGLGYRVPLVIASPWNRGGRVCSEVFDHTSVLQFLEKFLSHKTGKKIEETNISAWRRAICGDLTSTFRPYQGEKIVLPIVLEKNKFIENVHKSQFRENPSGYKALTPSEINQANNDPASSPVLPKQEKGSRGSCALPYELYVDGSLAPDKRSVELIFRAGRDVFKEQSSGCPFNVYAIAKYKGDGSSVYEPGANWSYAVEAGDKLKDTWLLKNFENGLYHLQVHGPNGFAREFKGDASDPALDLLVTCQKSRTGIPTGNADVLVKNRSQKPATLVIKDESYGGELIRKVLIPGKPITITVDLTKSHRWYDFTIRAEGSDYFMRRYSGRIENGMDGLTDPAIGSSIS